MTVRERLIPFMLRTVLLFAALTPAVAFEWAETLDTGVALAAARSEPLLVVIEGPVWCLQCSDAVVQLERERLTGRLDDIVAVRVADDAAIVERFAVRRLPTVVLLDSGGNEISRMLYRHSDDSVIDFVEQNRDAVSGQIVRIGTTRLHRSSDEVWHLSDPYPVGAFHQYDQDETFWYLRHENATILAVAKDGSAIWSWDHGAEAWRAPE